MIDLSRFPDLANIELDHRHPKETSIAGDQIESYKQLWTSDDGRVSVGVWECTEGVFTSRRDDKSELCHFISGRTTIRTEGGEDRTFGPGDFVTLPKGWVGEWHILEKVRKLYIVSR